jgi:hypothetical protein
LSWADPAIAEMEALEVQAQAVEVPERMELF